MSLYSPESSPESQFAGPAGTPGGERRGAGAVQLILTELNPHVVVDTWYDGEQPRELLTFGTVRELCPKCRQGSLKLVLRQSSVRMAHLFCADCTSCYDAQYADGAPALTI